MQRKFADIEDKNVSGMLDKADHQINKMTAMINGFLDVSRLESGKIHIHKESFDLAASIREAEDESMSTVDSHQIIFDPVASINVNADKNKIGQVIHNLISNAVKYSPKGSTIQVSCYSDAEFPYVSVKDEGRGIEEKDVAHIFDRHYRVESTNMHLISGFGIGLYLCSEIINHHNGSITVESEIGKGSEFIFSLPL